MTLKRKITYIVIALCCVPVLLLPSEINDSKTLKLDSKYLKNLAGTRLIKRDEFIESGLNSLVSTSGKVISIDEMSRYRKNFRVIVEDSTAHRYKFTFTYYLFFENEEIATMVVPGEIFEFRGQLVSVTPLNSRRDSYILDIILETGSVVIK